MDFHVAFTPAMPRRSRRPATLGTMEQVILRDGEEPPLAAHLVTPRRGYIHHGLYVGEGRIIHYPGLVGGLRRRAVEEVSLEEFARGRPVAVRMGSQPRFAGVEAVRRARSRLGENRYDIIRNNCEHFCEWCLSGVSRSRQLESLPARVGAAAIAILDTTATWVYRTRQLASL
jgi:lecithin:retinol acyltransferase